MFQRAQQCLSAPVGEATLSLGCCAVLGHVMTTRVLGNIVGISIIRFLNGRPDRSAYWREISKEMPDYPRITMRRQLESLEDAGVITVSSPFSEESPPPRGSRAGTPVLYTLDAERLDTLFTITRKWLTGGNPPPVRL